MSGAAALVGLLVGWSASGAIVLSAASGALWRSARRGAGALAATAAVAIVFVPDADRLLAACCAVAAAAGGALPSRLAGTRPAMALGPCVGLVALAVAWSGRPMERFGLLGEAAPYAVAAAALAGATLALRPTVGWPGLVWLLWAATAGRAELPAIALASSAFVGAGAASIGRPGPRRAALLLACGLGQALVARGGRGEVGAYSSPDLPRNATLAPTLVAGGLGLLSAVAVADDGSVYVSAFASGEVLRAAPGPVTVVGTVALPQPPHDGRSYELGLWGLAVAPDGRSIVAMAAERVAGDDAAASTSRIVRVPLDGGRQVTLLAGIPAGPVHAGGALLFLPDGTLLASVGDGVRNGVERRSRAELPGPTPEPGAILRLRADGSAPPDNPWPGSPVWARGLRNVYGLAVLGDGTVIGTENGPAGHDRLVRLRAGADFRLDGSGVLWDSGDKRLGPTGVVALGPREVLFATFHTAALHRVQLGAGSIVAHSLAYDGRIFAPPRDASYRHPGAWTGLAVGPTGVVYGVGLGGLYRIEPR